MAPRNNPKDNEQYELLVSKLREVFQMDRSDLDFGIYRILGARTAEIDHYLSVRLREKVSESLAANSEAQAEQLKADIKKAEKAAKEAGISPDEAPKVVDLRKKIQTITAASIDCQNQVFSHLLTFFSRYFDEGDFISQRRYKDGAYAIPYAGEEIMMHWANRDQYFIKNSETFSNFSFKLKDKRTVHFRIAEADIAKDNRKETDKKRFALIEQHTIKTLGEEGEEDEMTLKPITEENGELVLRFSYAPHIDKQEILNDRAKQSILKHKLVQERWKDLEQLEPTEKNPDRTILERYLSDYTHKNSSDYFIHKDLATFLKRELDFYIKNEMMSLDDIQGAKEFSHIEANLQVIKCLQSVALDLISFLNSIENLQKKLWLKKKFIVSAQYCFTLDKVPQDLYPAIVNNPAQWQQWKDLGIWSGKAGKIKDLQANQGLMVDTSLFDISFKEKLLSSISDLDETLDGILIQGDNFQALSLLAKKYSKQVDLIYIDPPYNTVHSQIAYKNKFRHSSWLSLIDNTLSLTPRLVKKDFSFGFAIDDHEYNNALSLIRQHFVGCDVDTVVINHHPAGRGGRLSGTHEYYIVASPKSAGQYLGAPEPDQVEKRAFRRSGDGENNFRKAPGGGGRPNSFYALLYDPIKGKIVGAEPAPPKHEKNYPKGKTEDGFERIYPINSRGEERVWNKSHKSGKEMAQAGCLICSGSRTVYEVINHKDKRKVLKSNWFTSDFTSTKGTALLENLGLGSKFDYPKSVKTMEQALWMQSFGKTDFLALDYFAGSGTTAHAIINLNRSDKGTRKYILVEQGHYFDSVTCPRIKKAVYADKWASGKPSAAPPQTALAIPSRFSRLRAMKIH